MSQDPAHMEGNLGRCGYNQSSVDIHIGESPEGLHHGLLICLCMVNTLNYMAAACKCGFQISGLILTAGTEIAHIVSANGTEGLPVLLRMN